MKNIIVIFFLLCSHLVLAQEESLAVIYRTKYIDKPEKFIDFTKKLETYKVELQRLERLKEGNYPYVILNEVSEEFLKEVYGLESKPLNLNYKSRGNKYYLINGKNCNNCDSTEIGKVFLEVLKMSNRFIYIDDQWYPVVLGHYDFDFYIENMISYNPVSDTTQLTKFIYDKFHLGDKGEFLIKTRWPFVKFNLTKP